MTGLWDDFFVTVSGPGFVTVKRKICQPSIITGDDHVDRTPLPALEAWLVDLRHEGGGEMRFVLCRLGNFILDLISSE